MGKRGLCNTGQKRNEKKEKHIFTYMPPNEATAAAGLARLEGRRTVEGWGFEDSARGVKSLCNIGQKGTKKERKEKNITCVPANGAMVAAGVGAREGCDVGVVACIPADGIVWSSLLRAP